MASGLRILRCGNWILFGWVLIQLPFLWTAFRIDEPNILVMVRQIALHPFDPYGYEYNWHGTPESGFVMQTNPMLVPAWLALWSRVFAWSEASFHLAMLPFSLVSLHAMGLLAKFFKVNATIAMLLLCCSPAFFLASQVIMMDIAMLAFFLLAVAYAVRYEEGGSSVSFWISFLAAFSCPLAKYNGVVLVLVLGWLLLFFKRRAGLAALAGAPIISLVIWNGLTWARYGQPHFFAIAAFQKTPGMSTSAALLAIGTLTALGLGVLPLAGTLFLTSFFDYRKLLMRATLLSVMWWIAFQAGYGVLPAFFLAFSLTLSLHLLMLTGRQAWHSLRTRDFETMSLPIWILAGLLFQAGLMFSSVRYLLFIAPAAILMILKEAFPVPSRRLLGALLAGNVVFVTSVAIGDAKIANGYRSVVRERVAPLIKSQRNRLYFTGHWGLQYYAERIGGEVINEKSPPSLQEGDVVVAPALAVPGAMRFELGEDMQFRTWEHSHDPHWAVRTIGCEPKANFYASGLSGCGLATVLPFGFTRGLAEVFSFYQLARKQPDLGIEKP